VTDSRWTLLSRGDRVPGHTWKPARGGPHPVVILCTPDGVGGGEAIERARAALSGKAALASFDLTLCGARKSDKLSAQALDPTHPLSARLRPDLEAQTAADLEQVVKHLRADPDLDGKRISLVAAGIGAGFARGYASGKHGLAAVELHPEVTQISEPWMKSLVEKLLR
jgi:dienelactone hydrolase